MPTAINFDTLKARLPPLLTPCLFLDIDGTLAPFTIDPSDSQILAENLTLIKQLQNLGVPVAVVTGRSLAEARQMLAPLALPIGATHGLEVAFSSNDTPVIADFILDELPLIIAQIQTQLNPLNCTQLRLEKKPYSVALHFRQHPDLAQTAENIMQNVVQHFPNWQPKQGKFVWEIMPIGIDKGRAVIRILTHFENIYQQKFLPIFIGDDVSDEAGFLAVQANNGIGIKVGETATTHAKFFIQDIHEVTQILHSIYDSFQNKSTSSIPRNPFFPNEPSV